MMKDFGLKNKREIWKAETVIRGFRSRARRLFTEDTGKEELFRKLKRLGIFRGEATLDDVLGLKVEDILERRLQTLVFRKGLAQSPKQARQLIVHRHVTVDGKIVNVPGYIVTTEEEGKIAYAGGSPISDGDHPVRSPQKAEEKPEKEGKLKVVGEARAEKIEVIEEESETPKKEGEEVKEDAKEGKD